jgi:hypothetical protein
MSRWSLLLVPSLAACALAQPEARAGSDVLTDYALPVSASVKEPVAPPPPTPSSGAARAAQAKGVAWLLAHQHADGGWSSGNHGTDGAAAPSDVATTAYTVLALLRDAGGSGRHADAIRRGTMFVVDAVRAAPQGPRVRTPEGTQIQYKLGPMVDTHFASLVLGEVIGHTDPTTERAARSALDLVVGKVAQAQQANGSFEGSGWAPVLSTSVAASALDKAAEVGAKVDQDVIARSDAYQAQVASSSGFDTSGGAGVKLYAVAGSLANNAKTADRTGPTAPPPDAKAKAEEAVGRGLSEVRGNTAGLVAGYGSIGGEEVLSYQMISDTLAARGGSEWTSWNGKIGSVLAGAQNQDGSWAGHHCITSRAFATAGAVMTLAAGDWAHRSG